MRDQNITLWTAYLYGVLTSFTPCVYPIIPVTVALFGADREASRIRAFLLSTAYVLGMGLTYTALGLFSAKTGAVFGTLMGNPVLIGTVALFLFILLMSTVDVIHLSFFSRLQSRAHKIGGEGFVGAFLMGSVSGFVAAPCVGPALFLLLGFAAKSENTGRGALLLFSYSLGLGTIFILVGTFSGLIQRLPRSGPWLHGVKFVIAASLGMAIFGLLAGKIAFEPQSVPALGVFLLAGLALGFVGHRTRFTVLRGAGALLAGFVLFHLILPTGGGVPSAVEGDPEESVESVTGLQWHTGIEEAVVAARYRSTIVMVDLYADWCVACRELDEKTFSNDEVKRALGELSIARIDFTEESTATEAVSKRYGVLGLPTVLFLSAEGEEIPDSRITGFVPPRAFLDHLGKLRRGVSGSDAGAAEVSASPSEGS